MADVPQVKIGKHEFPVQQVIDALEPYGDALGCALSEMEAARLAGNLPTMVLAEELECRSDLFRDFLAQLQWRTDVQGMDLNSALSDLAAENGNEWPLRTVA